MKSTYRNICVALLIGGFVLLLIGLLVPAFIVNSAEIIGGADMPTYEFRLHHTLHGFWYMLVRVGAALAITGIASLVLEKTVKSGCTAKTGLLALGLSAGGSAGLYCCGVFFVIAAFGEVSSRPLAYPASVLGGLACLCGCLLLLALYIAARRKCFTIRGVLLDIALVVVFFGPLLWMWQFLHGVFSDLIKLIGI